MPSSRFVDTTGRSIFLPSVPEIKPRTLWACQESAFIGSASVAPFGRRRSASACAVLLPSRKPPVALAGFVALAALGAFFAGVAFFPAMPLPGATAGFCGPAVAFLLAFGCGLAALSSCAALVS